MASTRISYIADGSTDTFNFPFPYIDRTHVQVYLDGVLTSDYSFVTGNSIKLDAIPSALTEVLILRSTPGSVGLTQYQRGSTLTARDLTVDSQQARYLIQELADESALHTDTSVAAEAAARIAAVNDEEQARIAGDVNEKNQRIAAIEAEELARTLADNDLDQARIAGDANEAAARIAADEAEELARIVADNDLDTRKIDRDEIPGYLVSIGDDAAQVGFQAAGTGAELRSVADKLRDIVSVKDFGATGDGVTDDTAAIMAAYTAASAQNRGSLRFPPGIYRVTALTFTGSSTNLVFDRATLYGAATTAQDAVVTLHNFRNATITNMEIQSDGNVASPSFVTNYNCALRLSSDNGGSPTQFLTIDGLNIRYIKAGIVHGGAFGDPPLDFPQSEIFIRNFRTRGVQQIFYGNMDRGFITFTGCTFVRYQFESSSSWYDAANGWVLRNDAGYVNALGCEFQVSEAGGWCNYGKDISIIGCVYEHSVTDYITGNYELRSNIGGYYGSNTLSPFTIAPGSTGRLLLDNVFLRRPAGTATTSRSILIDAIDSPEYRVVVKDSEFRDWASDLNNEDAYLLRGGVGKFQGTTIDNSASAVPSLSLDDRPNALTNVDTTGLSMSTTLDSTAKGGWSAATGTGGAYHKYTADLPSGHTSAIRVVSTAGSGINIASPTADSGFPVSGSRDNLTVRMLLKRLATTELFRVQVRWFDFAGGVIGSPETVYAADDARLVANGFSQWSELRIPVEVPSGAAYGRIIFAPGNDCDFAVTDLAVV